METPKPTAYRGRFAPTPSGPLHLGSLLAATASWLDARSRGGSWLLRIDDLDRARCPPGMDAQILRQLEAHGLRWDETPRYQSDHLDQYRDALAQLERRDFVYACTCSRAALKAASRRGPDDFVYPGACRDAQRTGRASRRLRLGDQALCFDDGWQGRQCRSLAAEVGDFVVRRADGQYAYQLACAVDEVRQGVTDVVRGADLLGSTFRQLRVLEMLGLPPPGYRHLPVLADARGRKLSKQNHAPAVAAGQALSNLRRCLRLMNQDDMDAASPEELLRNAAARWDATRVSRTAQISDLPL
ncbi:MAG: tRNA glutamyl-Q(34) synthetase GluQRS [Gammaproteobacteria bacterium]